MVEAHYVDFFYFHRKLKGSDAKYIILVNINSLLLEKEAHIHLGKIISLPPKTFTLSFNLKPIEQLRYVNFSNLIPEAVINFILLLLFKKSL